MLNYIINRSGSSALVQLSKYIKSWKMKCGGKKGGSGLLVSGAGGKVSTEGQ